MIICDFKCSYFRGAYNTIRVSPKLVSLASTSPNVLATDKRPGNTLCGPNIND